MTMFYGSFETPSLTGSGNSDNKMQASQQSSPHRVETPTRLALDGTEEDLPPDITTTMEAPAARRISSSLLASSETVQSLFGESVGPCWGDFSCTHLRIRGRLYATSCAILFYTNLLGFERRICLLLRDVVELGLYRTTSIRIQTLDLETYIFKSFNDREQVLHLLNGLKILADKQSAEKNRARNGSSDTAARGTGNGHNGHCYEPSDSLPTLPQLIDSPAAINSAFIDTSSGGAPPVLPQLHPLPPPSPNRRRAASDSVLRLPVECGNSASALAQGRYLQPIGSSEELMSIETAPDQQHQLHHGRLSPPEQDAEGDSPTAAWEHIKKGMFQLTEVGIEDLPLSCSSVDEYYKVFLADDARYPLDYYQKEYVKDKNVEITGWDMGADGPYFHRTITFTHPIKNSMGIGPSSAQTTRQQRLHKFPSLGCMAVENKTFVEGLPGADCFYVQDMWLLEAVADDSNDCVGSQDKQRVKLSVHYDVQFKKRSLFKNIIQKSVRKETKEWIAGYVDMVQGVLRKEDDDDKNSHHDSPQRARRLSMGSAGDVNGQVATHPSDPAVTLKLIEKLESAYRLVGVLVVLLVVMVLFFSFQIMEMKQCLADIRTDLRVAAALQPHADYRVAATAPQADLPVVAFNNHSNSATPSTQAQYAPTQFDQVVGA